MLELNKIYNTDCLDGLRLLDDYCIDLTVTSPPYDNLRTYNGYSFDFENIANDHIISWSNENDVVMDIFVGSGTTAKMALLSNRKFIGFEISKEYCDIANKRIEPILNQIKLF